jgi:hypothetical protein
MDNGKKRKGGKKGYNKKQTKNGKLMNVNNLY